MKTVIKDYIKKYGQEAFHRELRRILGVLGEADLRAALDLKRHANVDEVDKVVNDGTRTTGEGPCHVLTSVQDYHHYYVTKMGEIVLLSEPYELNLETTAAINEFCHQHGWTYHVLSGGFAPSEEPSVLFRTGYFVSP